MRKLVTSLAVAAMVAGFAISTPSTVHATEESDRKAEEFLFGKPCKKVWKGGGYHTECQHAAAESPEKFVKDKIDELESPDETDVADSGNEGATSAAQESDQ